MEMLLLVEIVRAMWFGKRIVSEKIVGERLEVVTCECEVAGEAEDKVQC